MTEDFAATTLDKEAMTFDEPLVEPAPRAPVAKGPAWAGTLAKAPAAAAPAGPPPVVEPQAPAPAPPPEDAADPTDFAATSLHQRAYTVSAEPPVDELSEHNRVLSALPEREAARGGAPSEAGDRWLMIGLAVVGSLIALLLVVLLFAGLGAMLGPG